MSYILPFQPTITDQGAIPNCIAHACATAKQVLEWKEHGRTQQYSIDWIYGNRASGAWQGDGYDLWDALEKLVDDGVPPYYLLPDQNYYSTAKRRVQDNYSSLISIARNYRISWHEWVWADDDIESVKDCLYSSNGIPILFIWDDNWENIDRYTGSNGILGNYQTYNYYEYHCMVIIGWKTINGKDHYICQNSWGEWWGDDGLCYVPYDHASAWEVALVYDATSPPPLLTKPTGLMQDLDRTTENSIYLSWNPVSGANGYHLYIQYLYDRDKSYYIKSTTSTNLSVTVSEMVSAIPGFDGLNDSLVFDAIINAYDNTDEVSSDILEVDFKPPKPIYVNHTLSSSTVRINWDSDKWNSCDGHWVYWKYAYESEASFRFIERLPNNADNYTFSNLDSNTQYTFRIKRYEDTGSGTLSSVGLDLTYTTLSNPRPDSFYWTYPKNSGGYFNLTATEWNRLIQNIKDVYNYKGWNISDYPMSQVGSGNTFYAWQFNQVKNAIGSKNATGITDRSSGNTIYASYLNTLRDKINGIT